ncbi:MAG TPA: class I SAM-dependent methyltransferase [Bryobacteraceae bacterium]|jgi:ubiquinone/menaquinone biosynthesis C-methylase UbiE|nr:class I SAM-dependent methyltransferase [Bryobacteraceae bacterium]
MDGDIRRQFLKDYSRIRRAEGRGSSDPEYYRALPYRDLTGKNSAQWAIRARSYRYFESRVLPAIEKEARRPLDILDLGAGNGWMSYRLALRNHRTVALDIFADQSDGLRAARNYTVPLACVEAEFDQLPFADGSFDLAVYNSSLHYSTDYRRTLTEVRRCLRKTGRFAIVDSPVYKLPEHGEQMRNERHEQFERQYGFRSDAAPSIEFFDEAMLHKLGHELNIEWTRARAWYGLSWALRPLKAKLRKRRPPSQFLILTGRFRD